MSSVGFGNMLKKEMYVGSDTAVISQSNLLGVTVNVLSTDGLEFNGVVVKQLLEAESSYNEIGKGGRFVSLL